MENVSNLQNRGRVKMKQRAGNRHTGATTLTQREAEMLNGMATLIQRLQDRRRKTMWRETSDHLDAAVIALVQAIGTSDRFV